MIIPFRARIHTRIRAELPGGSLISIVIWVLPEPTKERPHGYKYRLNYSAMDGTTLVRYDNALGEGDHKHLGEARSVYKFESIDRLQSDFWSDVQNLRKET